MIFNSKKLLALALSLFAGTCAYSMPTHKEVMDELAQLRKEDPRLQEEFTPEVKSFLHEVDEAKILDETKGSWDYWTKYAMFTVTTPLLRDHITLLTKENAPKTYEFVASIAQKVGFTELPLIYLVNNEKLFNAFATGYLQSMSFIALGEKLVKETIDTQALEFVVAHELAHVYNRHIPKQLVVGALTTAVTLPTFIYAYFIKKDLQSKLASFGVSMAAKFLISWYSRVHERDADITAARAVGAQGGIDLFSLYKTKTASRIDKDYELLEQEIQKTSLKDATSFARRVYYAKLFAKINEYYQTFYRSILGTHPSDDERIAYLTELLKEDTLRDSALPAQA